MAMPKKPLSPAQIARARLDHAEQRVVDGEASSVMEICRLLKRPKSFRDAMKNAAAAAGRDKPGFQDFMECWPDFPIFLMYAKQKDLRSNASLGNLFPAGKFGNQWFVKELLAERANQSHRLHNSPICLLIDWPYMTGKMALHTMGYESRQPGLRIRYTVKDENVPTLTLEPLSQLLEVLAPMIGIELPETDPDTD